MAKVTFASLKLKVKDEVKKIQIGEKEIEVKQYLPAVDKNAILENAMQRAEGLMIVNTFALDAIFHLYIVMEYTNLSFTDTQTADLFKLYDLMETNGIIDAVLAAIPKTEYDVLRTNLEEMLAAYNSYRNSAKGIIDFVSSMNTPAIDIENLKQQIDELDIEKAENIINLAKATGIQYDKGSLN